MDASIVIVCFGRRDMTERCLASLDRVLGDRLGRQIELVLVDNASPDDTLDLLARWSSRATVVALEENRNFSGGCNAGADAASGDVLVFLNNDTVVEPDTLEPLVETVREPGVGIAGLRLLYPDGTVQHAGVAMAEQNGYVVPFHVFHQRDGSLPETRGVLEMDVVTGACLAIPRALFAELGGFEMAYVNGLEDVDLCLRARLAGHRVIYRGDLAFVHDEGATRAGMDTSSNYREYFRRWHHQLDPDDELAEALWGARPRVPLPRDLPSAPVALVGSPLGIGPACDELRALLVGLEELGIETVAVDSTVAAAAPALQPRLGGRLADVVVRAMRRGLPDQCVGVAVPDGRATPSWLTTGSFARVPDGRHAPAGVTAISAVPTPPFLWAPPAIDFPLPIGRGGRRLLVSLPSHDTARTQRWLEALATTGESDIRVVPTSAQLRLEERVARALPGAELLPPCSHDAAWAELAASADVAVCPDVEDGYERRALVAAGMGAAPVVLTDDGPATAVLGRLPTVGAVGEGLVAALDLVARSPGDRAERAGVVRSACAPRAVANVLVETWSMIEVGG